MSVAVARPDDYDELASFMAGFPGVRPMSVDAWRNRLRSWWDLNPAFEASFPRGWLLRDEGRIVGFFGSLPLKMQLLGRETTAFGATSWRVLPDYRGKSLGLKLRQLDAHKDALHFSTTPREDLLPLLKRLGYVPIPRGPGAERQSVYIVDHAKFLRFRFRDAPLGPALATLAAPAFGALQWLRTRGLRAGAPGEVRELSRADDAFDDLWRRTRTRFANTNLRTAQMVTWYCFAMQPSNKRLLACYDAGTLLGYMVLLVRQDPGRKFLECVDLWMDPAAGEQRVLAALAAKAADVARAGAFDRVNFPHFDARTSALYGASGLLDGPAWRKREYVKGPRELLAGIAPENSYFVRAQGDYGL